MSVLRGKETIDTVLYSPACNEWSKLALLLIKTQSWFLAACACAALCGEGALQTIELSGFASGRPLDTLINAFLFPYLELRRNSSGAQMTSKEDVLPLL